MLLFKLMERQHFINFTNSGIFGAFRAHTPAVQKLLVDNIKAELSAKINAEPRKLSIEQAEPLPIDTSDACEAELRAELQLSVMKIPKLQTADIPT
ncbi:hypothetical protein BDZ91DRAFT_754278 [Kalaharituber pfeilii]|nr:hypothetical protein BDZ91DRAFT_754278 [Kalaharituber pfeilii]